MLKHLFGGHADADELTWPCVGRAPGSWLVDCSCGRRISYAEYGETVESLARGLIAAGVKSGGVAGNGGSVHFDAKPAPKEALPIITFDHYGRGAD